LPEETNWCFLADGRSSAQSAGPQAYAKPRDEVLPIVTIRQAADQKYARTLLMGTKETAEAHAEEAATTVLKVTQKVHSTGISSSDTARIANKVPGKLPSAQSLRMPAHGSGIAGAVIGAGIEAVASAKDLKAGNITSGEFWGRVAKEVVKGGVIGAAATAACSLASAGIVTATGMVGTMTAPVWFLVATGVAASIAVVTVGTKFLNKVCSTGYSPRD